MKILTPFFISGAAAMLLPFFLTGCVAPSPIKKAAATAQAPRVAVSEPVPFSFNLLPKSFQANPELDMTVFTEMTPEGLKLKPATRADPVYFVAQPDGFQQLGDQVAGEKPPPAIHIDYFVRKVLGSAGYLSVPSREVRPSLFILYRWGTHNASDPLVSEEVRPRANSEVLARARLVGGPQLVREMMHTMEWGEFLPGNDGKKSFLKDQAYDSCYFVIIFAYDFEAMMRGEKRLYWRTNMTVNTRGVSLKETLPPLIASAAPYLGKEMKETAITSRPLYRRATVDIGTATVVDYEAGAPESAKPKQSDSPESATAERKRPR